MGESGIRAAKRALWILVRPFACDSAGHRRAPGGGRAGFDRHHVRPQGRAMISVDEAVERITRAFAPLPSERVPLESAAGRVLAADVTGRFDHPPAPMSAMDGYADWASDAQRGATLAVIGDAPAGRPFAGSLEQGQAVRIFTGGVVPNGADA